MKNERTIRDVRYPNVNYQIIIGTGSEGVMLIKRVLQNNTIILRKYEKKRTVKSIQDKIFENELYIKFAWT